MYYTTETIGIRLKLSERSSIYDPWPPGHSIQELNSLGTIYGCCLTADELIIFFAANIPGGLGGHDIWMASREDKSLPFGDIVNLTELNTAYYDGPASISPDGLTLYFGSDRNGSRQIFVSRRSSLDEPFGPPEHLTYFDTPQGSSCQPAISSDGTELYFVRSSPGKYPDIWVSHLVRQQVPLDIKPGSCPNPLNLYSRGVLPVAVLGTEDFDVNTIDLATVRLEGVPPVRSHYEDVATPPADGNECNCSEEGPDGYTDVVLHFRTQQVAEKIINAIPDITKGDLLELKLTGKLMDGTLIEAVDCVVIVGKAPRELAAKKSDINGDGIIDLLDFSTMASFWLETTAVEF